MSAYPHLFSPLRIGNVTVRNRIMQTAHVKLFAEAAVDSQRNVDYQAARARGGAGLLITGNRVVHPTSTTGFPRVAWQYLPEVLESDRRLHVGDELADDRRVEDVLVAHVRGSLTFG